jgi:hypothetical protein
VHGRDVGLKKSIDTDSNGEFLKISHLRCLTMHIRLSISYTPFLDALTLWYKLTVGIKGILEGVCVWANGVKKADSLTLS